MTPEVIHNREQMRFELSTEAGLAVCEYREEGGVWLFTHTEVPEAAQGRGLAGVLVGEALREARASGHRVRPLCSYVASYLSRRPEYSDLIC